MLKQYEDRLDSLLEHINPQDELHLTEIEEVGLTMRQQVGADVSQALVNCQTQTNPPDVMCPTCGGRAIFSLDERWQLGRGGFSTQLSKQIIWLSGLMTFAQVNEVLGHCAQVSVPQRPSGYR